MPASLARGLAAVTSWTRSTTSTKGEDARDVSRAAGFVVLALISLLAAAMAMFEGIASLLLLAILLAGVGLPVTIAIIAKRSRSRRPGEAWIDWFFRWVAFYIEP